MKAVMLHEYGGPENLRYEEVADPKPGVSEVLIRLAATSINPIDTKMRSGAARESFPVEFPAILGRDVAGVVEALGPGVTELAVGDRVIGLGWKSYAELVVAKAADMARIPDELEMEQAAALPLVTLTGEQLISRGVQVKAGETVLVTGAVGGVGRTAVFVAKKAGAKVIAGVRKSQLEKAAELGADEVLALDDTAAVEKLAQVDAVADTVNGETAATLLGKVKPGGVFASVLGPPKNAATRSDVRIAPVRSEPDGATLKRLAEDVAAGRLKIPVAQVLPLAKAEEAQRATEQGKGKIVLTA